MTPYEIIHITAEAIVACSFIFMACMAHYI